MGDKPECGCENPSWCAACLRDELGGVYAENARLRAALAVVADPNMWFHRKADDNFTWNGEDELADPMKWASRSCGADCRGG